MSKWFIWPRDKEDIAKSIDFSKVFRMTDEQIAQCDYSVPSLPASCNADGMVAYYPPNPYKHLETCTCGEKLQVTCCLHDEFCPYFIEGLREVLNLPEPKLLGWIHYKTEFLVLSREVWG